MFRKNLLYLTWHKTFTSSDKKMILSALFRIFVEYCLFFILLSRHHTIAMVLFQSQDWYIATFYFDILFSVIFGLALVLVFIIIRYRILCNSKIFLSTLIAYTQTFYLVFFVLGLSYLRPGNDSILILFIIASLLFVAGYAHEKIRLLGNLIKVIKTSAQYLFFVQAYFFALSAGLIVASLLNKMAVLGSEKHISGLITN